MAELLADLAAAFKRDLRAEGRAERTGVIYGQAVTMFSAWLVARGRPATLDQLTRSALRAWLAELADKHQASTVQTRYRSMRRFCGWLVAEGELAEHPMTGMAMPPAQPKPVPVLSDDDLAALLKVCDGRDFASRRDTAVIRMLVDCGVRVSELCGITLADLDLNREVALVTGKGNKRRAVYFGARTGRALDRYLRERRTHRQARFTEALFLSQRGPLSPDGVRDILNVRGAQAGVTGLHPHRFRHTFAHDFLVSGGQERDLKRLAGWSSDVMLERYGSSAADMRAREAVKRMRRGDRV